MAGVLGFAPGILLARSHELSRLYVVVLIPVGLVAPGMWAIVDTRPMGLWPFEHNEADAILHLADAATYAVLLIVHHAIWGLVLPTIIPRRQRPRRPGTLTSMGAQRLRMVKPQV